MNNNIREMINSNVYRTKLNYPHSVNRKTASLDEKEAYKTQADAWQQDQYRLEKLFREDLEKYFFMTLHPKRDKLFEMAWSRGHASGLFSVYDEYVELLELVRD